MIQGLKHETVKHRGPKQKMQEFARQTPLLKPWGKRRQGPTFSSAEVLEDMRSNRKEARAELGRPSPFRARFGAPLT
jgi:hypothetical protein